MHLTTKRSQTAGDLHCCFLVELLQMQGKRNFVLYNLMKTLITGRVLRVCNVQLCRNPDQDQLSISNRPENMKTYVG
jgi:hypothetical protein